MSASELGSLLAELDACISSEERRFEELLQNAAQGLDTLVFSGGLGEEDESLSRSLRPLHLSRKIEKQISQAVKEEKRDVLVDFLEQSLPPPPPPPPPPPQPPQQQQQQQAATASTEEKAILSRLTAEAKATLQGKDREIRRLGALVQEHQQALQEQEQWQESTRQYAVILVNSLQAVLARVRDRSAAAVRETEHESLSRLCATLLTHVGASEADLDGGATEVRKAVRRRSTARTLYYSPTNLGHARRRSLFGSSDSTEEEHENAAAGAEGAKGEERAAPQPFTMLREGDEAAAGRLFELCLHIQSASCGAGSGGDTLGPEASVGRKAFLLLSLALGLAGEKVGLDRLNAAFEKAVLSGQRSKSKFTSRLLLNDFVVALGFVANTAFPTASAAAGVTGSPLQRLLQSVEVEAAVLLSREELRLRWVEVFWPCVQGPVWAKLAESQELLRTCYSRCRSYGLFTSSSSSSSSCSVPASESKSADRGMLRALGLPADTALTAGRSKLAAERLRSPPGSAVKGSTSSNTSSNSNNNNNSSSSSIKRSSGTPRTPSAKRGHPDTSFSSDVPPSTAAAPHAPASSVSLFEAFCVNYLVVPLLTRPALPRRIAQHLLTLDPQQSFRGFLACLAYLCLALADGHDQQGQGQGRGALSAQAFAEAIDKVVALIDGAHTR